MCNRSNTMKNSEEKENYIDGAYLTSIVSVAIANILFTYDSIRVINEIGYKFIWEIDELVQYSEKSLGMLDPVIMYSVIIFYALAFLSMLIHADNVRYKLRGD